jgi:hypothetical protein
MLFIHMLQEPLFPTLSVGNDFNLVGRMGIQPSFNQFPSGAKEARPLIINIFFMVSGKQMPSIADFSLTIVNAFDDSSAKVKWLKMRMQTQSCPKQRIGNNGCG